MNRVRKGQQTVKFLCEQMVKHKQFQEYYICPRVRFLKNTDIFNHWDGVAIKKNLDGTSHLILFQSKTNLSGYYAFKKIAADWIKQYGEPDFAMLLFCPDKKKIRLYYVNSQTEEIKEVLP